MAEASKGALPATLAFSPTAVNPGDIVSFSGSGYQPPKPNDPIIVYLLPSALTMVGNPSVLANGSVAPDGSMTGQAQVDPVLPSGDLRVDAYEYSHNGQKLTHMAFATLTIV